MTDFAKFTPVFAMVVDSFIGDPRVSWHPVVLIGKLITWLEGLFLRFRLSPGLKRLAGFALVLLVLAVTYGVSWGIMWGLAFVHPFLAWSVGAVLLAFTISPRSLAESAREIKECLDAGDIVTARFKVGWVVGRDTAQMDAIEVTRATVETVAENVVDGVIAPLFYAFIGGVPLAYLYRAVNTLDSMVGYRNDKYIDFGMVAARVDDCFNYIPARITGLLMVIAALLAGYDAKGAIRTVWRDAAKHPSPNSGIAEAAVAGALGIRLGGQNYYGGVMSFRAYMGEPCKTLKPSDIAKTIRIMYVVTAEFIVVATALVFGGAGFF
ncbi:MAG: cobD 1 [Firmicutes bacterium]|nr:cobD 1 [Bacillota bacterium]